MIRQTMAWLFISAVIVSRIFMEEQYEDKLANYIGKDALEAEIYSAAFSNTITMGEDGKIRSVTPGAAALFGYTQDELRGMEAEKLMPERYRSVHRRSLARRFLEPIVDPYKIVNVPKCEGLRKDGTEMSMEVRTKVINTDSGKLAIARFTLTKDIETVR